MTSVSKCLIINADDFGYCPERNRGIIEAFLNKKISSATLLVNSQFVAEAVQSALEHNLPLGLHFNITEGQSIAPNNQVHTLCDKDTGLFLGKFGCRHALESNLIEPDHILFELEAQIKRFIQLTGKNPTHVDGHQHIHVHPSVIDVFANVLNRNGITWTRIPHEQLTDTIPHEKMQFYNKIFENCNKAKSKLDTLGIRYPNGFVGLSTMGTLMTQENLANALNAAFTNSSLVELMVHPGYPSKPRIGGCDSTNGPDEFSQSTDRLNELIQLSTMDFLNFLNKSQIKLVNF